MLAVVLILFVPMIRKRSSGVVEGEVRMVVVVVVAVAEGPGIGAMTMTDGPNV